MNRHSWTHLILAAIPRTSERANVVPGRDDHHGSSCALVGRSAGYSAVYTARPQGERTSENSVKETVWKVAVRVEWRVLWQREAPNRVPFRTVLQAKGTTKWSPFGLSRQSLEGEFSEVEHEVSTC